MSEPSIWLSDDVMYRLGLGDLVPQGPNQQAYIDDYTYRMGGRAEKPTEPLVLTDPFGTPVFLVGAGVTEAAELQDIAYEQIESFRTHAAIDFDEWRDRKGLASRDGFAEKLKDAAEQAINAMKGRKSWAT